MIVCDRIRPDLKAYVDGQLPALSRLVIRWHLRRCADCRKEVEAKADPKLAFRRFHMNIRRLLLECLADQIVDELDNRRFLGQFACFVGSAAVAERERGPCERIDQGPEMLRAPQVLDRGSAAVDGLGHAQVRPVRHGAAPLDAPEREVVGELVRDRGRVGELRVGLVD